MGIAGLETLLNPRSVAVIGASNQGDSLGTTVMRNLLRGDFEGPVMPVNAKYRSVLRVLCYPTIQALPVVPELAIICTPPRTVPMLLDQLGKRGTKVAVVLTVDTHAKNGSLGEEMLAAARPHGLRFIGPGSTGVQVPTLGLNASWITTAAKPGRLALVTQSGALASGVLEWATARGIGFSHVISAGDAGDIDIGDVLDHLAMDGKARAVLLYLRTIGDARKFLSAARALSRIKPVIAIRANRRGEVSAFTIGAEEPQELTDAIYDAAFRRVGMLRVHSTDELFDAVETLAYSRPLQGDALAILCNGSGPGEVAADTLVAGGGRLARLSQDTLDKLSSFMPERGRVQAPVDIGRDGDADRYRAAMKILIKAPEVNGVLVMHTPSPVAEAEEVAREVAECTRGSYRNVLACWLGHGEHGVIHEIFGEAKVPVYATPDKAARGFLHLVAYRRNQDMLHQTPIEAPKVTPQARARARAMVEDAVRNGPCCLDESRTAAVLDAYGLPTPDTRFAHSEDEAVSAADDIGYPVSLRLASATVTQKLSVGNMTLDLNQEDAVRTAAKGMRRRFRDTHGDQHFPGYVVQRMVRRAGSMILMAGIADDPLFGPVIRFGPGGASTSVQSDHAVALPPLNSSLASELISRTRVGKLLATAEGREAMDEKVIRRLLVRLSDLLLDIPQIRTLDVNPLLADRDGFVILDGRLGLSPVEEGGRDTAIRTYPAELEEKITLRDGSEALLRPVRPEDEPAYRSLLESMAPGDLKLRFCGDSVKITKQLLAPLIHIDYDREMAFVLLIEDEDGNPFCLGAVNTTTTADNAEAEYSIVVRTDRKGLGLGRLLMERMIEYCRARDTGSIFGLILHDNESMLALTKKLGFARGFTSEEDMVEMRLRLQ